MNHKRHRTKSTRGGCLLCKPWKRQGTKRSERVRPGIRRKLQTKLEEE